MPFRVLVVSWEYPPIVEGGLARAVRKLSEALVADEDVEVHVLTRAGEHGPLDEIRHGVHVHRVREPHYPSALPEFVQWVGRMNHDLLERGRELIAEHDFDIVHGHDWLVAVAAKRLADRIGAPFVATVHATEHGRHQGWVHKPPQSDIHRTERWMVGVADQVLVCSHYMRGHVADVFGIDEERIVVAPNGIDPDDLQPVQDLASLRARFAAPDEKLVLLVGRLVYEKGFQHALEALAGPDGVIARVGGVRFLVAGSGTHEWELKDQARRLGLTDHGTFMGWIGDDVLHSLYRIADLTVVPSIYEPFGLVALEAMASGCPCIVADTGGLREVVPNERVGLRFTAKDPRSLGRMVERVLTDDALRDRLVAEASEHVLRFDWTDVARQTHEAYRSLLGATALARRLLDRRGLGLAVAAAIRGQQPEGLDALAQLGRHDPVSGRTGGDRPEAVVDRLGAAPLLVVLDAGGAVSGRDAGFDALDAGARRRVVDADLDGADRARAAELGDVGLRGGGIGRRDRGRVGRRRGRHGGRGRWRRWRRCGAPGPRSGRRRPRPCRSTRRPRPCRSRWCRRWRP